MLKDLVYAERLGLWDTSHSSTISISKFCNFSAFYDSLSSRGLGSLELLALELKQQGSFIARTLSFKGAEFFTAQVALTCDQERTYDLAVEWWTFVQAQLTVAIEKTKASGNVWRNYWSAHQRMFKELAICFKIPFLVKDALQQVQKHNRCVVIGLQSTGDAGMQSIFESNYKGKRLEEERFDSLMSTASAILTQFIEKHFPVKPVPPVAPKLPKEPTAESTEEERHQYIQIRAQIARLASLPPPEPLPELVKMKKKILKAVSKLDLPPNPLDWVIDQLGGPGMVAEMTGRAARMERRKGYFVYTKRGATNSSDDSDRINLVERRQFMDGSKPYAIISDAASTGISLHSARGSAGGHKRRVHYTIERAWSGDSTVQQLGRSHRSAQVTAPLYKLVVTQLGGERRFAAAVSKRLGEMGALTRGDRRAGIGGDMSSFNLDTKFGKRSLKRLYTALNNNEIHRMGDHAGQGILPSACLPSQNTKQILSDIVEKRKKAEDPIVATLPAEEGPRTSFLLALMTEALDKVGLDRDKSDMKSFLNRLAGITVCKQDLL